jgi:diguanylate cyclase (GGDEF)-like protein
VRWYFFAGQLLTMAGVVVGLVQLADARAGALVAASLVALAGRRYLQYRGRDLGGWGAELVDVALMVPAVALVGPAASVGLFYGATFYRAGYAEGRRALGGTALSAAVFVAVGAVAGSWVPGGHQAGAAELVGYVWGLGFAGGLTWVAVNNLLQSQRRLAAEQVSVAAVLNNVTHAVVACDVHGEITMINDAAYRYVAWAGLQDVRQFRELFYDAAGRQPVPPEERPLARVLRGETVRDLVLMLRAPGGDELTVRVHGRPLLDASGTTTGAVVTTEDVTERYAAERELQHLATHDPLTGLGNRALLAQRGGAALEGSLRVGILLLDLDGFKEINDGMGHGVGDSVLIEVAQRLRRCVRPGDTVVRLGGDEFAALLPDVSADQLDDVARRIHEQLREPVRWNGLAVPISCSIGTAGPVAGEVTDLLRFADMAMYRAKSGGKGRTEPYRRALQSAAERQVRVHHALRLALAEGSVRPHYQPIVRADTGAVAGVEGLARWTDPELGPVSPVEFVPIAEANGLVRRLDEVVLVVACTDSAAWVAAGLPQLSIGVNLSAQGLGDGVLTHLASVLETTGMPAHRLILEVTESSLGDVAQLSRLLFAVKDMGVLVAVDDFGSGYSSLGRIRGLPLDVLKIDRSIVQGCADPQARSIAAAAAAMARSLGVDAVAEGVETVEQAEIMRDLGFRYLQGFLFSRPVPATDVPALLAAPVPG